MEIIGLAGLKGVPGESHGRGKSQGLMGLTGQRSLSRGSGTKILLLPWDLSYTHHPLIDLYIPGL